MMKSFLTVELSMPSNRARSKPTSRTAGPSCFALEVEGADLSVSRQFSLRYFASCGTHAYVARHALRGVMRLRRSRSSQARSHASRPKCEQQGDEQRNRRDDRRVGGVYCRPGAAQPEDDRYHERAARQQHDAELGADVGVQAPAHPNRQRPGLMRQAIPLTSQVHSVRIGPLQPSPARPCERDDDQAAESGSTARRTRSSAGTHPYQRRHAHPQGDRLQDQGNASDPAELPNAWSRAVCDADRPAARARRPRAARPNSPARRACALPGSHSENRASNATSSRRPQSPTAPPARALHTAADLLVVRERRRRRGFRTSVRRAQSGRTLAAVGGERCCPERSSRRVFRSELLRVRPVMVGPDADPNDRHPLLAAYVALRDRQGLWRGQQPPSNG